MALKRSLALAACVVTAAAGLAACSSSSSTGDQTSSMPPSSGPQGTLRYAVAFEPTTWEPLTQPNTTYLSLVYDGLVRVAADGVTLEPDLATKWTLTPTEAAFTLRQGVTFSDGTPFNAQAVIANIEHIKSTPSSWQHTFDAVESMSASGDYQLTMKLSRPAPTLLGNLAGRGAYLVSPKALSDKSYLQAPAGTGPYTYDSSATVKGSKYVFDFNPKYYDKASVGPAKIEVLYIKDINGRYNSLLAGDADVINNSTANVAPAKAAGMESVTYSQFRISVELYDRATLFKDVRVRQAVCYAVNKDAISQAQYDGLAKPATQRYDKGSLAYVSGLTDYPYDMDKAKRLMAEAGNPKLTVKTPMGDSSSPAAREIMKADFAKLGIDLQLVKMSNAQYFSVYQTAQYPFINDSTSAANAGPYDYYMLRFAPTGNGNPFKVPPPSELADAVQKAIHATDQSDAAKDYQRMTQIIHDQALDCGFIDAPGVFSWNPAKVSNIVPTVSSPSAFRYWEAKVK